MSAVKGRIVLLPTNAEPVNLIVTDEEGGPSLRTVGSAVGSAFSGPVMLVLPPSLVTLRVVDLDPAMPDAQARSVAVRKAGEMAISSAEDMHVVPCARTEDDPKGRWQLAMIAKADMARLLEWVHQAGYDPDVILPAAVLVKEPEHGFVRADFSGLSLIRGAGLALPAEEPWAMDALASDDADVSVETWTHAQAEAALLDGWHNPPVNLRSGPFALKRKSAADAGWLRRIALMVGVLALVSMGISVALIARYEWSASRLDRQTVELVKPLAPSVSDAAGAAVEVDRLIAERGGAYAFSGPLAGLMNAMRPVPAVVLSALSLNEDGLLHATLASARAEDINTVLLSLQGAGFRITATSSTDPGGRVLAEITVKP